MDTHQPVVEAKYSVCTHCIMLNELGLLCLLRGFQYVCTCVSDRSLKQGLNGCPLLTTPQCSTALLCNTIQWLHHLSQIPHKETTAREQLNLQMKVSPFHSLHPQVKNASCCAGVPPELLVPEQWSLWLVVRPHLPIENCSHSINVLSDVPATTEDSFSGYSKFTPAGMCA